MMKKPLIWILIYVLIVAACIYIVVKRYLLLQESIEKNTMEYVVLIFFILFTFINLRILIKRIKEYKK